MTPPPSVEAFVLAGGRSTRFGRDKALVRWGGRPMLVRALAAVRKLGLTPRVVSSDPDPYLDLADAFVIGERPGRGPLEALRVLLRAASSEWALVLAADMPWLGPELPAALIAAAAEEPAPEAVCFLHRNRRHPFPGLYHRALGPVAAELGDEGSLQSLLDRARTRTLGPGATKADLDRALGNVNRPGDLERPS